jgi:hypothetical protein
MNPPYRIRRPVSAAHRFSGVFVERVVGDEARRQLNPSTVLLGSAAP